MQGTICVAVDSEVAISREVRRHGESLYAQVAGIVRQWETMNGIVIDAGVDNLAHASRFKIPGLGPRATARHRHADLFDPIFNASITIAPCFFCTTNTFFTTNHVGRARPLDLGDVNPYSASAGHVFAIRSRQLS